MFRFTIRDVLWLTVVVAILSAWWLDHRKISPQDREAVGALRENGWGVSRAGKNMTIRKLK